MRKRKRVIDHELPGMVGGPVPPRESEIQAAILEWLRVRRPDMPAKRIPMGQGFHGSRSRHSAGLEDITCTMPPNGRRVLIEVKRPGSKPRKNEAAQREWLEWNRKVGALVIVATSVEDVARELA